MPVATLPSKPRKAIAHLKAVDSSLSRAIDKVGPFRLPRRPATLHQLCVEIIGQQLSVLVAARIAERFSALAGKNGTFSARRLLAVPEEKLRAAGLSGAKTKAVYTLAEFWEREKLKPETFTHMPDEEIIDLLTQVKGIGPWTVKMFLIFCLHRPDVLPQEDLGMRAGIRKLDGLDEMPPSVAIVQRAEAWAPWRTVGTWYTWAYLGADP